MVSFAPTRVMDMGANATHLLINKWLFGKYCDMDKNIKPVA